MKASILNGTRLEGVNSNLRNRRTHFYAPFSACKTPCFSPSLYLLGLVSRRMNNETGIRRGR